MQVYSDLFDDATPERMDTLFKYLDKNGTGQSYLRLRRPPLILITSLTPSVTLRSTSSYCHLRVCAALRHVDDRLPAAVMQAAWTTSAGAAA